MTARTTKDIDTGLGWPRARTLNPAAGRCRLGHSETAESGSLTAVSNMSPRSWAQPRCRLREDPVPREPVDPVAPEIQWRAGPAPARQSHCTRIQRPSPSLCNPPYRAPVAHYLSRAHDSLAGLIGRPCYRWRNRSRREAHRALRGGVGTAK
jgi:hypothetical protein